MTSFEHEHGAGQGGRPPTTYSSADAAVDAILWHAFVKKNFGLSHPLGPELCPMPLDWSAAARAIVAGAGELSLDGAKLRLLDASVQEAPDHEANQAMHSAMRNWAETNWVKVEAELREEALKQFSKVSHPVEREFSEFVARWPRLKTDLRLIAEAIQAVEQGRPGLDAGVAQLRFLRGDQDAAARVLAAVMARRTSFRQQDDLASLFAEWAGDGVWANSNTFFGGSEQRPTVDKRTWLTLLETSYRSSSFFANSASRSAPRRAIHSPRWRPKRRRHGDAS